MSLRNVVVPNPAANTQLDLVRVAIVEGGLFAVWRITGQSEPKEVRVEVTQALANNILGRVAFQTMLDNIAADTQARAVQ